MSILKLLRGSLAACLMYLAAGQLTAGPPSRIAEDVSSGRVYQLSGNTRPLIASAPDKGAVPDQTPLPRITLSFKMSDAQQAALTKLLADQQNPANSHYHKWLTPEQYGTQFGMSSSDMTKVRRWLSGQGFTNIQVARSKNLITMSGTVGVAQDAFRTAIHRFDVNGAEHFANTTDPYLPAALQNVVHGIRGLTDLHPHPHAKVAHPHFTSSISGNTFMAPGDFATIYDVQNLYNAGVTGTGQKIAIAGQTDIQNFDIEAFQTAAGLTVQPPTIILDGADPGLQKGDLSEAELDVEWAGAVARGATIVYVNSSDAFNSAVYAITNQVANILSLTYGSCEAQVGTAEMTSLNMSFQQAAAQGMTVIAAAGDSGAADCDYSTDPNTLITVAKQGLAVDFPASSPYVTGMGGTQFNEGSGNYWSTTTGSNGGSAVSYIPEEAWNDDCSAGVTSAAQCTGTATYGLSATGGGVSTTFTKPSWQTGTGVPADGFRDVPDVSIAASPNHDGYLICETDPVNGVAATTSSCVNGTFRNTDTTLNVAGGTSVASPAFAGIVALINQLTGSAQGAVNPRLYTLASIVPDAFHDITIGSNVVPCTVATTNCTVGILGYNASVGYDQVTGIGTIDAYNLVENFAPSFTLASNPTTLTVANSSSGTATVTVAAVGGFTGSVSFSCSVPATLGNTTCSIPGTITGSGSTTLTISNSTSTSNIGRWFGRLIPPVGTNTMLPFAVLLLVFFASLAATSNRTYKRPLAGVAVLAAVLMTGCGGGSSSSSSNSNNSTPAVTGTVTVTAVSSATELAASTTKSITIAVTEP